MATAAPPTKGQHALVGTLVFIGLVSARTSRPWTDLIDTALIPTTD